MIDSREMERISNINNSRWFSMNENQSQGHSGIVPEFEHSNTGRTTKDIYVYCSHIGDPVTSS